jgi:hypothetical protein
MSADESGLGESQAAPRVRKLGPIPVYDCHLYLSGPDEQGVIHARGATLDEIGAEGRSEREVLASAVAKFKAAISGYTATGQAIPWHAPEPIRPDERQRLIPVHF